jgi:hypothetical protein
MNRVQEWRSRRLETLRGCGLGADLPQRQSPPPFLKRVFFEQEMALT